jgi:hypothetical protein
MKIFSFGLICHNSQIRFPFYSFDFFLLFGYFVHKINDLKKYFFTKMSINKKQK